MKKLSIALVAVLAAGCAAPNTGIVQVTDNTYMYAKQDWSTWSGAGIKPGMYKEAQEFCAKEGKKMVPISSTSQDAALRQSSASAEIHFACN